MFIIRGVEGTNTTQGYKMKTAHAQAIAALIVNDHENSKHPSASWSVPGLVSILRRAEKNGFDQGVLIRECLKSIKPGFGYAFPPAKRVTPAMRIEIVEILEEAGLIVELRKVGQTWRFYPAIPATIENSAAEPKPTHAT